MASDPREGYVARCRTKKWAKYADVVRPAGKKEKRAIEYSEEWRR